MRIMNLSLKMMIKKLYKNDDDDDDVLNAQKNARFLFFDKFLYRTGEKCFAGVFAVIVFLSMVELAI